jgi:hypothetical protein
VGSQGGARPAAGPTRDSQDEDLLAAVPGRERRWAAAYLVLYLPGILSAKVYFAVFAIPTVALLVEMSVDAVATGGLLSLGGLAAATGLALCLIPLAWTVGGVIVTATRTVLRVLRPRPGAHAVAA